MIAMPTSPTLRSLPTPSSRDRDWQEQTAQAIATLRHHLPTLTPDNADQILALATLQLLHYSLLGPSQRSLLKGCLAAMQAAQRSRQLGQAARAEYDQAVALLLATIRRHQPAAANYPEEYEQIERQAERGLRQLQQSLVQLPIPRYRRQVAKVAMRLLSLLLLADAIDNAVMVRLLARLGHTLWSRPRQAQ